MKISKEDSKYLKSYTEIFFLKFFVVPNGLFSGPGKFSNLNKPSISCLRIEGAIVAIYIDGFFW